MRIDDLQRDPLGQALLAYHQKGHQAMIHVYSDIAIDDVLAARYLWRTYDEMPHWEQLALQECRGRVMDIGAGAGSHSLWLEEQGNEVVAVDVSPGAVQVMQERGVRQVVHEDFRVLEVGRFDTLLLLMNGIGLVGDFHGLNAFFTQARTLLKPGGQILLDSSDIRYLYESEGMSLPLTNGRYHGIITYQMAYEDIQGDPFDWLYVDFATLARQATHLGWTCECLTEGPHYEYLARLSPNQSR